MYLASLINRGEKIMNTHLPELLAIKMALSSLNSHYHIRVQLHFCTNSTIEDHD